VGQKLQNFQNYQKNVKKEEYNKYIAKNNDKKIEQQKDYRIKKEKTVIEKNIKKEFKKPINIEKSKRTEIIKKYEIVNNKKPEVKKKVENDYKKYERKKKDETKQEIKIKTQSTQSKNKTQVQKKTEIKKAKEPIKEPKIINSRELIKKEFSVHSGRYSYKENISNDITNSRKNYNANSQDKNLKRITVVQNSDKSQNYQLIFDIPFLTKKSLVLENGLLPKNPLFAENGDGCGDSIIKCCGLVISFFLSLALFPHSINTTGFSLSFNFFITSSVKVCHPKSL
jgi:hypothetical protein